MGMRDPVLECHELIAVACELHAIALACLQQPRELARRRKCDVLLISPAEADGAGINPAMARVEHHQMSFRTALRGPGLGHGPAGPAENNIPRSGTEDSAQQLPPTDHPRAHLVTRVSAIPHPSGKVGAPPKTSAL